MTAEAAPALDTEIVVLEKTAGSPAGIFVGAANELVGDWRDEATRERLASRCEIVTLENEFVDADALEWFVARGRPVYPGPRTVRTIQDKLRQKQALARAGLPLPRFRAIRTVEQVRCVALELGWPLVLKARRNGYDGYGNASVERPEEIAPALARLGGGTSAGGAGGLYVEEGVPFVGELAMMVARGRDGSIAAFPLVETRQRDHICHEVVVPARVSSDVAERARVAALGAVTALDAVGVVGVELFLLADGTIAVNELAPRPHNSGHYSIEGCRTSQFANHLRAVLGDTLGPTDLVAPAVAMVNLLGTTNGPAAPRGVAEAASLPDTFVHIYGKRDVRVGRKMGHVTALGEGPEAALARARSAANVIQW
jgi:5-(carboxyamino)imidazole ribonucleotide synthase